jgi:hypothetical protein
MKTAFWIYIFSAAFLFGCGGGGGNPGVCSGSAIYCADAAGVGGAGAISTSTPLTLFAKSGIGDTTFDLPARVTRVRIQGNFNGATSNFIVKISGQLVVNEILGTSKNALTSDGTYLLPGGGPVEIINSNGVSWSFTEVAAENSSAPNGIYSKSGTGDFVFQIPARVSRIRIQGNFNGATSNFIVKISGQLVVNEILGTSKNALTSDGIYLLPGGGTVEIISSSGVSWTFTEVQ